MITLGGVHKFRFNHPAEAAVLRERRRVGAAQLKKNSNDPVGCDGNHDKVNNEQMSGDAAVDVMLVMHRIISDHVPGMLIAVIFLCRILKSIFSLLFPGQ